jgi:hypothetical protein
MAGPRPGAWSDAPDVNTSIENKKLVHDVTEPNTTVKVKAVSVTGREDP